MATQHEIQCKRLEGIVGTSPFVILTNEASRTTYVGCPFYSPSEFTCSAGSARAKQDLAQQHESGYHGVLDVLK